MKSQGLKGKVALVAGATRGAGRGIAVQLGAAGATVYVTGRTTRSQRSEMNRPETIEETAALVDEAGGRGIAVRVDHLVPAEVRALVARIEAEQGRLHVLVNDIFGATRIEWTNQSGNRTWTTAYAACDWRWTRTPSPATSRYPCSSRRRAAWSSRSTMELPSTTGATTGTPSSTTSPRRPCCGWGSRSGTS